MGPEHREQTEMSIRNTRASNLIQDSRVGGRSRACWVRNGGGTCACGSGDGSGWSDGYNPDDPPMDLTDPELYTSCIGALVETCGEDPPALPDACNGEVLTECEAFVEQSDHYAMLCGDDVPEANIARIGQCCDTYSDAAYAEYRACMLAIESETCPGEQLDACEGVGADEGDTDGAASGAGESKQDGDGGSKGCSIAGASGGWGVGLVLLGFAGWFGRRR
jgi:hypothetical protein